MKRFLLSIFAFLCLSLNAQLDTDHWFAPMAAKVATTNLQSYLYLSTNETTPFSVQIFNNNTVYTTVQVSKNNPVEVSIPAGFMFATNPSDLFVPNTMGISAKGSKRFFANFRFSVTSHAEIITSKGLASLGTKFYAAMAPLTGSEFYISSMIGILATEDNTDVVISGYNPNVVFSDGVTAATRTVTLNKGQSYILDAVSINAVENMNGLVGAKIESTKPISVTNGNFNGIYTNNNFTNNDILMDQAVPVDKLGKDFALVKGNGSVNTGMETALIVATENNTTFTINGTVSGVTLNAGQYFLLPVNYYINQGNGVYNLGITATKNVYVYQLLAGTNVGNEYATGGFNFIPPLSCFMPNQIDEIAQINRIGNTTYATKLNILTQTGATVTINGANVPATTGPYPVPGNANWVTYSVPNVTGNITVNSTKSVTAGIAAGSGAVGYGGYFAGFSSVPAITKTGDCYLGVLLQVDSSYDSYQWFLNGQPISGATSYSINPETYGAGNYTCQITKNNCETKLTAIYTYVTCPPIPTATYTIGSCQTKQINPALVISTQTMVPSSVTVVQTPTSGTTSVNSSTGQITYTPNTTLTADVADSFIYSVQGNGNPADIEYFKVIINIDVLQVTNATLTVCANANGTGTFDLTSAVVTSDTGTTIAYYADAALTVLIGSANNYSTTATTVYAKVTSQYGCSKTAQITLNLNPSPNINTANYNANLCDDNLDGIININFSTVTPLIVTNSANFIVKYYLNQADANLGNANTLPVNWTYTGNTTVYVRVESTNGCPPAFGQINFTIANKITLLTQDFSTLVCDTNWDATESVDLNTYKNNFTTDPAVSLTFYNTLAAAQNATGPVSANQTIAPTQVFYVRFQSTNGCANVAKLTLTLDQLTATNASLTACAGTNGQATFNLTGPVVTTTPGAVVTNFSDAALTNPIPLPTAYPSTGGTVYAKVTSTFGCTRVAQITLFVNPLPNINTASFNGAICDDNLDGTVNVTFSSITPQIVSNSGSFTVKYYLTAAAATAGGTNNLPNNWSYTANTTIYVRVESVNGCPPAFGQINFTIGAKIPLITTNVITQVCDLDLSGSESVNLNDYKNLFTADPAVSLTFYSTLANAQNGTAPVNAVQNITGAQVFFVRFTSANACPVVAQISITLKAGKKSDVLKNQIVCPGQRALLDAGSGFTSYLWNTGATTQSILAGEGNYYVDLTFNGCVYRQNVTVTNAVLPTITSITVTAGTATINVSGGTPPYQYSINGFDYQTSNIFTGLSRGPFKAYVKSADGCEPVVKDFLIINLINAITPNGDGHNDYLDYTDLQIKQNVSIEVVDRYGAPLYRSTDKNYKWDGRVGNRNLPTGTYWYVIKWIEPETKLPVSYSGWLLIKNRE
ncbi:T9SS type B sorting domain-containing protein [Chryseobacterium caseinilyticum]|uniref:Gliding motility-associated C-terminal domain-containing protein n=1 Tax=Chryseobacterium caseinilyticum TaxID=2771428 RepID=A0ABR8ZET7_9FLAO|nr:T9SS type B sorting domain-containing protein [Chryseobacterium caseinilyticum]MBD8083727.1 gliding motility-associated C-terminal domain-containing protein [Chryseobacterium caseinilyticum]